MENIYSSLKEISIVSSDQNRNEYLIYDFLGREATFTFNDGSNAHVIYFAKNAEKVNFNVIVKNNANITFDLIFMNGESVDNFNFDITGEGSVLDIKSLSLAKNCQKDFNITVNHLAKYSKSTVTNYGISFDNGINNYTVVGKIPGGMTASDVRQITKGLLLSPSGACMAKPILLIDYFDVKAYHGATIGKISDDDLFYLMSRGLTKSEAFMLVINGMLEPFIKNITFEKLKTDIIDTYQSYFEGEGNE